MLVGQYLLREWLWLGLADYLFGSILLVGAGCVGHCGLGMLGN